MQACPASPRPCPYLQTGELELATHMLFSLSLMHYYNLGFKPNHVSDHFLPPHAGLKGAACSPAPGHQVSRRLSLRGLPLSSELRLLSSIMRVMLSTCRVEHIKPVDTSCLRTSSTRCVVPGCNLHHTTLTHVSSVGTPVRSAWQACPLTFHESLA